MPATALTLLVAATHNPYVLAGILTVAASLIVVVVMMATSQSNQDGGDT